MGQSSSRVRPSSSRVPSNSLPSSSTTYNDPISGNAPISESPRTKSKSRRSLVNFVKRRHSSIRHSTSSSSRDSPGTMRRSWRHSRRWSKLTLGRNDQSESSSQNASSSTAITTPNITLPKDKEIEGIPESPADAVMAAGPSSQISSHPNPSTIDSILPTTTADPEVNLPPSSPEVSLPESIREQNGSFHTLTDENHGIPVPGQFDSPLNVPNVPSDVSVHPSSDGDIEASPGEQTEAPISGVTLPPPPRPFPPPGTLVVVQGVVHTTDVPRPQNIGVSSNAGMDNSISGDTAGQSTTSEAQESSASEATLTPQATSSITRTRSESRNRNRLSALFGSRPSSSSGRRPSSASTTATDRLAPISRTASVNVNSTDANTSPSFSPESTALSTSTSDESTGSGSDATTGLTSSTAPAVTVSTSPQPTPPIAAAVPQTSSISSSSIDVLGTLLSVAAAATAASLLTGPPDHIMSSNLNNTASPSSPASPTPSDSFSRPTSPTPTAGLGVGVDTAPGRSERMRQAWGNIRERLGLRPASLHAGSLGGSAAAAPGTGIGGIGLEGSNAAVNSNNGSDVTAERTPSAVPIDTRERMLAEMARAFNLGLGLPVSDTVGGGRSRDSGEAGTGAGAGVGSVGNGESEAPLDNANELRSLTSSAPEGSFERFLLDLQTDLRTALLGGVGESVGLGGSNRPREVQHREEVVEEILEEVVEEVAGERDGEENSSTTDAVVAIAASSGSSPDPSSSIPPTGPTVSAEEDADGAASSASANSVPLLQPVLASDDSIGESDSDSDSDSDEEEEEEEEEEAEDHHEASRGGQEEDILTRLTRTRDFLASLRDGQSTSETVPMTAESPEPATPSPPAAPTAGSGRINWWRLYRFPPIAAPRAQAAAESVAANMRSSLAPFTASPSPSGNTTNPAPTNLPSASTSTSSMSSTSSSPSSEFLTSPESVPTTPSSSSVPPSPVAETRPNLVVPVIVVGLQSVSLPWGRHAPVDDDDFGGTDADELAELERELNSTSAMSTSTSPMANATTGASLNPNPNRGRRWHSRATSAFRNLRGGNRQGTGSDGQGNMGGTTRGPLMDLDGPGSRTFLIYVIGGYYPPDHSIVTGEPENLDSFEALLDLAELLGQVKPPTVSKEEIEKSGLEVIKPSQLEEHEKNGKIASNCIERCLICLDDYQPDDDIRILKCRHGFHMNCVDRWLQEGKNNCPACRSKGVTDDVPSPSSYNMASTSQS